MKIYLSHSTKYDYQKELYLPLKKSSLFQKHEIKLPHENNTFCNSKEYIAHCDLVIAEVSFASIGIGIELGWANSANVPVICIYYNHLRPSDSVKLISNKIIPYVNTQDMIEKLEKAIVLKKIVNKLVKK